MAYAFNHALSGDRQGRERSGRGRSGRSDGKTGIDQLREDLKGRRVAVIGEGMRDRVEPFADAIGAETFQPSRYFNENEMALLVNENIEWVASVMDRRYVIVDIGPSPENANYPAPTSEYYVGELTHIVIRQYDLYYPIWGTPSLMDPRQFNRLLRP